MLPPLKLRARGVDIAKDLGLERSAIRTVTADALNATAFDVRQAEIAEMSRVFDRPTRWTLGSIRVAKAGVLDLDASVYFKDVDVFGGPHYLEPQISGGARPLKRFEKRLQRIGVLPVGMYAVPGQGAKLDRFGNLSTGQIVQMLSQLKAFGESGFDAHSTKSKKSKRSVRRAGTFFAGRIGRKDGPLGVWIKKGKRIVPFLIFVGRATYRPRFDFYGLAHRVAAQRFPHQFIKATLYRRQRATPQLHAVG